jgi:energy-coupling factor transporter transmembrane protein EcfT
MLLAFPWVQFVLYKCWTLKKTVFKDKWISYLILWFIWIPLFFTFAKNTNHTYILPAVVPIALLVVHWWKDIKYRKTWLALASVLPLFAIVGTLVLLIYPNASYYMNTDKDLIAHIKEDTNEDEIKLYYWEFKSYSGQFYLEQETYAIKDEVALDSVLQKENNIQIFIPNKKLADFPEPYKSRLKLKDSNYRTSLYKLN